MCGRVHSVRTVKVIDTNAKRVRGAIFPSTSLLFPIIVNIERSNTSGENIHYSRWAKRHRVYETYCDHSIIAGFQVSFEHLARLYYSLNYHDLGRGYWVAPRLMPYGTGKVFASKKSSYLILSEPETS
jgi:hypothetical protein